MHDVNHTIDIIYVATCPAASTSRQMSFFKFFIEKNRREKNQKA